MRLPRSCLLTSLLILGASGLHAQDSRIFAGASLGMGAAPRAFFPTCLNAAEGKSTAGSAGVRAGINYRKLHAELRTSVLMSMQFSESCDLVLLADGVHSFTTSPAAGGDPVISDVRVGYAFDFGGISVTPTAGAGWVWSSDVPTLAIGARLGLGGVFRVGLEGELVTYRLPFERRTDEYRQGQVVQEIGRTKWHEWRNGGMIRLNLEVAPIRLR